MSSERQSSSIPSWAIFLFALGGFIGWNVYRDVRVRADIVARDAKIGNELDAMLSKLVASLEDPNGDVGSRETDVRELCEVFERNATGTDEKSKCYRAIARYFRKIAEEDSATNRLDDELSKLEALNIALYKNKRDIATRREAAKSLVAQVRDAIARAPARKEILRAELEREKASPESVYQMVARFSTSKDDVASQTRKMQLLKGEAVIELCDLAEGEWGKWKADGKTMEVEFDDERAGEKYEAFLKKVTSAQEIGQKAMNDLRQASRR